MLNKFEIVTPSLIRPKSSDNSMKSTWGTHIELHIPLIILISSIISPRYRLYFSVGKVKIF